MTKCYFVTARLGWQTVMGGHWLAKSPTHAIEVAKAHAARSRTGALPIDVTWHARKSKAVHNALNA